ncbi:MAG: hypothetical protein ACAI43_26970 [Phycisphaerae bacterium]
MQYHLPPEDLAELTRLLRVRVCSQCPNRVPSAVPAAGAARTCQATCPIFQHLPTLLLYAENLDPLVGSFDGVVNALAGRCGRCGPLAGAHRDDCPLVTFGHEVAEVLREEARRVRREPSCDRPHHAGARGARS